MSQNPFNKTCYEYRDALVALSNTPECVIFMFQQEMIRASNPEPTMSKRLSPMQNNTSQLLCLPIRESLIATEVHYPVHSRFRRQPYRFVFTIINVCFMWFGHNYPFLANPSLLFTIVFTLTTFMFQSLKVSAGVRNTLVRSNLMTTN